MKFIKKNKKKLAILLAVAVLVCLFLFLKSIFYPNSDLSVYGNRLKGIKDVPIKEDLKSDIVNTLEAKDNIEDVKIDIRGKIVNIIITANSEANSDTIKNQATEILAKFSDDQRSFYDLQFFATQNSEEPFYLVGYKNKESEIIAWSSNK